MKSIVPLFLAITLPSSLAPLHAESILYSADFNIDGCLENWTDGPYGGGSPDRLAGPTGSGEALVSGGALLASTTAGDPQLKVSGISVQGDLADMVVMRYRFSDGAGGWSLPPADLCLINASNQGSSDATASGNSLVPDPASPPAEGWYLATWDITDFTTGNITSMRVDAPNAVGVEFQVDYIRILGRGLYAAEFNTDGDFEGWDDGTGGSADRLKKVGDAGSEEEVIGGVLTAQSIAGDSQLIKTGLSIDSDFADQVVMRYRVRNAEDSAWDTPPAGDTCLVTTSYTPPPFTGFPTVVSSNQGNSDTGSNSLVADPESAPADGWHIATWDITDVNTATITGLRIDPAKNISPRLEVDYIRVVGKANNPPLAVLDPDPLGSEFSLLAGFEFDSTLEGWTAGNFGDPAPNPSVAGGIVTGTSSTADPQFTSPAFLTAGLNYIYPVPSSGRIVVDIRVKSSASTVGEFFWADLKQGFNNPFTLPSVPADGDFHTIRIKLDEDAAGYLWRIRYDPSGAIGVTTEIDYIRIYQDATVTWDSDLATEGAQGGSGEWNTTVANWHTTAGNNVFWSDVSTSVDEAIFDFAPGTVSIEASGVTANKLTFNVDGYTIAGGMLTLDGVESILGAGPGVTATIDAELARPASASTDRLMLAGPGSFDLGGGAGISRKLHFTTEASLTGGFFDSIGAGNGSNGMVVYDGATLTIDGADVDRINGDGDDALYIGRPSSSDPDFASSGAMGTLVLESGSLAVSGGRGITLGFAGNTESNTLDVNGGNLIASQINIGWNGKGIVNLNGGTTTVAGAIQHNDGGLTSELHLNTGATLVAGTIQNSSNLQAFEVYLNGGTLTPADDGTVMLKPTAAGKSVVTEVLLSAAGAVVDTDGKSTTIAAVLRDLVANNGTLTKQGAGTLTLTGMNTYTGDTTVEGGILALSGDSIADTGKLDVTGGKILIALPANNETVDTLYFNGVQQAAGVYGSSAAAGPGVITNDTFFDVAGTGRLTVTSGSAGNTYADWLISNSPATGFETDTDLDGLPNGVENVLGTDPNAFSVGLTTISGTATSVTFQHTLNPTIASDVSYTYEWSSDLSEWNESGVANSAGTIGTIAPSAPVAGVVTVVTTQSGTVSSKLFTRLTASNP